MKELVLKFKDLTIETSKNTREVRLFKLNDVAVIDFKLIAFSVAVEEQPNEVTTVELLTGGKIGKITLTASPRQPAPQEASPADEFEFAVAFDNLTETAIAGIAEQTGACTRKGIFLRNAG